MSGLQCWDANATLVVDIGDYNIRYVGTYYINVVSSTNTYTVGVSGMIPNGWFVHYAPASDNFNEWSAYCNNGSFTAVWLPGDYPPAGQIAFNVYKWTA